jgi:GNAT superfamily N-acetyltransferase
LRSGEAETCEEILRSLPEWFGIEEAILQYRRDIEALESYVAENEGRIQGFLTLKHHNTSTSEIQVLAVREEVHGRGIGRALIEHAERLLSSRSVEYLEVKTLGPSRPNAHYERTRSFYVATGFRPVEENSLWGPVNPCLILIKHLKCTADAK